MTDPKQASNRTGHDGGRLTMMAATLVLLLAVGALFWPLGPEVPQAHTLLVFDSSGDQVRVAAVFKPLQEFLATSTTGGLDLVVVRTKAQFLARLALGPDFVLAPDGLALLAPADKFLPLVVGRRAAPRNLRPRSVLVYRRSAGEVTEPWQSLPARTVFGDSVSLAAVGALRLAGLTEWPGGCAAGPDPYDHAAALHAVRLGGFDYAIVRQWDAERFFDEGLLRPDQFATRDLASPVPDAVLLVSRQVPQHVRLRCGEGLSGLGRQSADEEAPGDRELRRGLAHLHLAGFNVLVEPDFELVRKNYIRDWLPGVD